MDLFNKGQKIKLLFPKNEKLVEITCEISDVFYDRLELTLPQYFMRYIEFLQVGSQLFVRAFTKNGIISFKSIVISSPMEDVFLIELDYNEVDIIEENEIIDVDAVETLKIKFNNEVYETQTVSISPNSMTFISDKKFFQGDILDCELHLSEDYGIIDFKVEVATQESNYETEYKANFYTMTEHVKQKLLYFIYSYKRDIHQEWL